jgi:cellulose synthase/poly-beta-1,6-N-acetylglucosamine synthase-like glycosyltransferase
LGPLLLAEVVIALLVGASLVLLTAYSAILFAIGTRVLATQLPPVHEEPEVSIVIAALAPSQALEETMKLLQEVKYPNKKVLVALGSQGATSNVLPAPTIPVEILDARKRRGKAYSLNLSLPRTSDYVLLLDEDSHPDPDCIEKTLPYLASDPKVWAAVGLPYVTNPSLGPLQTTLALEADAWATVARAKEKLDLFLPATGFFALIKKGSLVNAGGPRPWNEKALAEDTELSVRQYAGGWRTGLSTARVGIEAPPTLRALFWQRLRWYKGMLEALRWNFRSIARLPTKKRADVFLTLLIPLAPAAAVVLLLLAPVFPGVLVPALLGFVAFQLVVSWVSSSKLSKGRVGIVLFSVPYILLQGLAAIAALATFLLRIRVPWQRTPKAGDQRAEPSSP